MKVIDIDSFSEEMDYDNDVINMVITELVTAIDEQLPLMEDQIAHGDFRTLNREAHSIKGGARNIFAEGLEVSSEKLEKAAAREDISLVRSSMENLSKEFIIFKSYIKRRLHLEFA